MTKGEESSSSSYDGASTRNRLHLLLLLRMVENEQIVDFCIRQPDENLGIGAFSDLILKVEYKSSETEKNITKLFCIHIQNEENLTLVENSPHENEYEQLLQYCRCYKQMLTNIRIDEDAVLKGSDVNDIEFLIYTNANSFGVNRVQMKEDYCLRLLQTDKDRSDTFRLNSSTIINTFSNLEQKEKPYCLQDEWNHFLNKLVVFIRQDIDLKSVIVEKLRKYISDENINNAYNAAMRFITDNRNKWLKKICEEYETPIIHYQGIDVHIKDDRFRTKEFANITSYAVVASICKVDDISVGKTLPSVTGFYVHPKLYKHLRVRKRILCYDSCSKHRLVLISAATGMGKTFGFIHQAVLLKRKFPYIWIIFENLSNYGDYLESIIINGNNKQAARNFLLKISMTSTPNHTVLNLEDELFERCLNGDRKMIIFLDNINQLSEVAYKNTITIINIIRAEYNIQIWICTRCNMKSKIEKDLNVRSWEIDEFTTAQGSLFMEKYCCDPKLKSPISYRAPLLCKLIQESINEQEPPKTLSDSLKFYPNFILKLCDIFISEEENKSNFIKSLSEVGLLTIFTDDVLTKMDVNVKEIKENCVHFLKEIHQNKEYIGILFEMEEERPQFIYKNIAEYLTAVWFHKNQLVYKLVISGTLTCHLSQKVDFLINRLFAQGNSLFELILHEQYNDLHEKIYNKEVDINSLDIIGRNALSYAAQIKSSNKALRILLNNGINVNSIHNLKFNEIHLPLFSCFALAKWVKSLQDQDINICLFLKYFIYINCSFLPYFIYAQSGNSPLHMSILKCQRNETDHFIKEDQFINTENAFGFTPLHLAISKIDIETINQLRNKDVEYKNNISGLFPHQCSRLGLETWCLQRNQSYLPKLKTVADLCRRLQKNIYSENQFPLFYLIQNNKLEDAVTLIKKNSIDVNQTDYNGLTALHLAAAMELSSDNDFLKVMLECKDIEYTADSTGYFPHDYAKLISVQHVLIEFGFKYHLNKLDDRNKTIFDTRIEVFARQASDALCR